MTATAQNSPDVLCAEILAEAQRKSDEILCRANAEAESILASAKVEAEKIRGVKREQAQTEAARQKEMILATVAVEVGRLRAARVEELLESAYKEIHQRLLARDFDAHETIVKLASEALGRIRGSDFILKISTADHTALEDSLAREIAQHVGRSPLNLVISADTTVSDGVILQTADGFQIWDNQLSSRLDRLWPELRRQIAVSASLVTENHSAGGGA